MKLLSSFCLVVFLLVPGVCRAEDIEGYQDIKFGMSLEEVTNVLKNRGAVVNDIAFMKSLSLYLDHSESFPGFENNYWDKVSKADAYIDNSGLTLKGFKIVNFDPTFSGVSSVILYKNRVVFIHVNKPLGTNMKDINSVLNDKYGPTVHGPFDGNQYIKGNGAIRSLPSPDIIYYNLPILRECSEDLIKAANELKAKSTNAATKGL